MAWIQIHQTLRDHRKTLTAADELEITPPHMLGLLVSLWLWALDNTPDGDLTGITPRILARAAQWDGDSEKLLSVLVSVGFVDKGDEHITIHDWGEYTGALIKKREAEAERSKRNRGAEKNGIPNAYRTSTERVPYGGRVEYSRVDNSISSIPLTPSETNEQDTTNITPIKRPDCPFVKIMELFNTTCVSLCAIQSIEGARRSAVRARWREWKGLETFERLFRMAEESDFLRGKNKNNWTATFDWIVKPSNATKVLEGQYVNKTPRTGGIIEEDGHESSKRDTQPNGTGEWARGFKPADD